MAWIKPSKKDMAVTFSYSKEVDEPMEEGEQGGDAKPTEDVNDKRTTPSDTSVALAQEGKSDEAPKTNTPNKEG